MTGNDLKAILPLVALLAWTVILLLIDLWIPNHRKGITAWLAALGLIVATGLSLIPYQSSEPILGGMIVVDGFARFLSVLFLSGGIAGIILAKDYLKRMQIERGEYYPLLLFSVCGMILMGYANNLLVIFLALELLSIPLYLLSGFFYYRAASQESALKYFLMGTFASAIILFGTAMVFGAAGSINLPDIVSAVTSGEVNIELFILGAGLLLVGFGFKVGIVPFHMWIPDVYQGAPSSVTGFMSFGAKAAGLAALMRVFIVIFPSISENLVPVLWVLAGLTMVIGNLLAVSQNNLKRLMAYSSIAHSGYLLMAFVSYNQKAVLSDSIASMLFYLVAYAIATFGVWAVIIAMERTDGNGLEMDDYAGLGTKHPWLAVPMAIFMFSFTGIPMTLGFWGKLYLFRTAIEGGFVSLAVIGVIASVISAYFYLKVILTMFMRSGTPIVRKEIWLNFLAIGAAFALVILSLMPNSLFNLVLQASINLQ